MTQSIPALTVGNVAVRQHNGLFSLNDLHQAAGAESKHQPAFFLRLDQAQALITELKAESLPTVETVIGKGKAQGTYACRELVIAYAAWISAVFHLKVIRVFLSAVAPQATPYSAQPGQTLSEEQAQALRAVLTENVKRLPKDKQAKAMIEGWSKLKAHFKTDYRHIPAAEFTEAVSIVARHAAQWVLDFPAETPVQPIAQPDTNRMQAAFDAAAQASAAVQKAVFNAVLSGSDEWKFGRWLLAFIDDSSKGAPAYVRQMDRGDFISTWPRLVKDVASGECMCTSAELLDMAVACMHRLQQRGTPARIAA